MVKSDFRIVASVVRGIDVIVCLCDGVVKTSRIYFTVDFGMDEVMVEVAVDEEEPEAGHIVYLS